MVYESSYESGRSPFHPDTKRGHWGLPIDFVLIGVALSLRIDLLIEMTGRVPQMGLLVVIPYVIALALYAVPMMVIQAFIGQFSSSGFISAFRLSPIFKGMGYVAWAVNFTSLAYYIILTSISLLFIFNSFKSPLPWSCEGMKSWSFNRSEYDAMHTCGISNLTTNDGQLNDYMYFEIPSMMYMVSYVGKFNHVDADDKTSPTMSWEMFRCALLSWSVIALVLYTCFEAEKLGKFLRYAISCTLGLLFICLIRFALLPGAYNAMKLYHGSFTHEWMLILLRMTMSLTSGFGTIITLSSFNRFKTNVMRQSWYIGLGQLVIVMMFITSANMIQHHFQWLVSHEIKSDNTTVIMDDRLVGFMQAASAMVDMEWPNMWTILYYTMLTFASWIVMITQLYSILTSLYDDILILRCYKREFMLVVVGLLTICSTYFCTNDGVHYLIALPLDALVTQTALHLLLLLVVLWVYGRERFQRDIQFMINQPFATWKINMLRYVAPIFLLCLLLAAVDTSISAHLYNSVLIVHITAFLMIALPWVCIPAYAALRIFQTSGTFAVRFNRCARPTDWYPVESVDRQRYEETVGNVDITHQLSVIHEQTA